MARSTPRHVFRARTPWRTGRAGTRLGGPFTDARQRSALSLRSWSTSGQTPPATPLTELFDDVDTDDADTFAEQVARELPAHGAMPYRSIPQGWRQIRSLYEMQLPYSGWFIDITGAASISVVSEQLGPTLLADCGIEQLTSAN
jgi:hypothetical protein